MRKALAVSGVLWIIGVVSYSRVYHAMNPELTEMQIFQEFWWQILLCIPAAIASCGLFTQEPPRGEEG